MKIQRAENISHNKKEQNVAHKRNTESEEIASIYYMVYYKDTKNLKLYYIIPFHSYCNVLS